MGTAISIEGLSKRFGGFEALAPLDLDVDVGEVLGYLGPNGAGKTVTIRLLLGLLRPSAGRAEIFGLDTHRDTIAAHRHLSYVAGETNLCPGSPAPKPSTCSAACRAASMPATGTS